MEFSVHHYLHFDGNDFPAEDVLGRIARVLEKIVATQAELTAQLNAVNVKVEKIGTETRSLLTKIDELQAVIVAGPVSSELKAAADALAAQADVVDELVPDAVAPTP